MLDEVGRTKSRRAADAPRSMVSGRSESKEVQTKGARLASVMEIGVAALKVSLELELKLEARRKAR